MTLSASPEARSLARQRWSALANRLRTIRPESLVKGAIGLSLVGAAAWLSVASWPALAPFAIGAVIAYAVLPIANRLDRIMPRWLAALLAELLALGLLVVVVALVVPPLLAALGVVAGKLPAPDQVQAWITSLQAQVGAIPEPMRTIALAVLTETAANLQGVLQSLVATAADVITSQLLGIFGTVTNVLGLLVIPAWILTVVADERAIKQRGARLFPVAVRADVAALFRIVDRVASTFLRVRVALAVVTGVLVYLGVTIANELGIGDGSYAMAAAVLLGSLQLIPELGFYLGFIPILIPLAIGGPVPALAFVAVYIASVKAAGFLMEGRLTRGVLDVHPGLLIPAIVVLSQFGLVWLFAAAPAVAIIRDLVRYANLRLADPPGPAGVLPGEKVKRRVAASGAGAAAVPAVYRPPVTAAARGATASTAPSATASKAPSPATPVAAVTAAGVALTAARQASSSPAAGGGAAARRPATTGAARPGVPSVYANLPARPGARPSPATTRSAQP